MIKTSRRGFLVGLGALVAAPAIVRAESLMPVRNRLVIPSFGYCVEVDTGVILNYMGKVSPGYLPCTGQALSKNIYPKLFEIMGTIYGNGAGLKEFNLPYLRGRTI